MVTLKKSDCIVGLFLLGVYFHSTMTQLHPQLQFFFVSVSFWHCWSLHQIRPYAYFKKATKQAMRKKKQ